jgi:hypothetical protein
MATQPPHDDKSKKTDAAGKRPDEFKSPKSPKTPRPEETRSGPRTPKPTVPNM